MLPSLDAIRQSTAEILAYTIRDLVPDTLFVKGEHTNIGFYYDFIIKQPLDNKAIPLIEERMRLNIKQGLQLKPLEMMRENAVELFKYNNQPFQATFVSSNSQTIVPIVQIGTFYDLCYPPFEENPTEIGAFKILSITKEKINLPGYRNLEITRISGTSMHDQGSLKSFLKKLDAAKKNDHKNLGNELNLFTIESNPVWLPKGASLRESLINWWKSETQKHKFSLVKSSSHAIVYSHFTHSTRDLPIKYAEITEFSSPARQKTPPLPPKYPNLLPRHSLHLLHPRTDCSRTELFLAIHFEND